MAKSRALEVIEAMKKAEDEARPYLDRQARIIMALDKRLNNLEVFKKNIEEEKQKELEKMQDLMEAVPTIIHSLPNGYTVAYDHKRKMEVDNMASFLRWLKTNCEPHEVLSFFQDAIKSANLKKFVEKKCDEQRQAGVMEPKIDGIDIKEITFRRLTTFFKGDKK